MLARLHTVPAGSGGPVSQDYLDRIRPNVGGLLANRPLFEQVGGVDIGGIQQWANTHYNDAIAHNGGAALAHGDFHPGNVFADPVAGATAIDYTTLHHAMDGRW